MTLYKNLNVEIENIIVKNLIVYHVTRQSAINYCYKLLAQNLMH